MTGENRRDQRVRFSQAVSAWIVAIDGTWRRSCAIEDISDSGAKLEVQGSLAGLQLKEFFLLLTSVGVAYRRCELIWINGEQMGVSFIKPNQRVRRAD